MCLIYSLADGNRYIRNRNYKHEDFGRTSFYPHAILNIIVTEHDFVLNLNHQCSLPSAELTCTRLGQSRLRVSAVEINRLYDVYRSSKDFSLDFGVSVRTLERRQNIFNI